MPFVGDFSVLIGPYPSADMLPGVLNASVASSREITASPQCDLTIEAHRVSPADTPNQTLVQKARI